MDSGKSEKFSVGIARCRSYDPDEVSHALRLAISRSGGFPEIAGDEVLIKTNLLSPSPPENAVTTHPQVLRALAGEIKRRNNSVHIADSPGYLFNDAENLLSVTGLKAISDDAAVNVGLLSDRGMRLVKSESFAVLSEARIACRYLDAPFVVNAAKLKTHVETEISCCIKNIFGTADTSTRKKAHRSISQTRLANAIVDLFTIRPPQFNVLDAIIGMEGDGPSHGRPREIGWLIAGRNALAVDWAAAEIMCYRSPLEIPLLFAAASRGIGPRERSEIILDGADWSELPSHGFKKSTNIVRMMPTFIRGLVHNLVSLSPCLQRKKCDRCGICKRVCPVDEISLESASFPLINPKDCVKCLCCNEMCPTGAMSVHKNFIARAVSKLRGE